MTTLSAPLRRRAPRALVAALLLSAVTGLAPAPGLLPLISPRTCLAADWQRQAVREASLEIPAPLAPGPDILANLPANVRDKMKTYEMRISQDGEELVAVIARIEYVAGVDVSLPGAVNGAMRQAAQALGDTDPKFDARSTEISGLKAQIATYKDNPKSKGMRMDAAIAQRGQVLFQVQVIYKPGRAKDAERILKSIRIDAAAE